MKVFITGKHPSTKKIRQRLGELGYTLARKKHHWCIVISIDPIVKGQIPHIGVADNKQSKMLFEQAKSRIGILNVDDVIVQHTTPSLLIDMDPKLDCTDEIVKSILEYIVNRK